MEKAIKLVKNIAIDDPGFRVRFFGLAPELDVFRNRNLTLTSDGFSGKYIVHVGQKSNF